MWNTSQFTPFDVLSVYNFDWFAWKVFVEWWPPIRTQFSKPHSVHPCACYSNLLWNHCNFGAPRWDPYSHYRQRCLVSVCLVFAFCIRIILAFGLTPRNVEYYPNAFMEISLSVLYRILLYFNPSRFHRSNVFIFNRYLLCDLCDIVVSIIYSKITAFWMSQRGMMDPTGTLSTHSSVDSCKY